MSDRHVPELTILDGESGKNIFNRGDRYEIPLYQRPFAWGEEHIERLIEDIADLAEDGSQKYYLGSLVVSSRDRSAYSVYEVIDGQQRLTTLYLLLDALGEDVGGGDALSLSFTCRAKSDYTLAHLRSIDSTERIEEQLVETGLAEGRRIIAQKLETDFDSKGIDSFKRKLMKTCLYRIEVPDHTDLNHYFEIMNTRGEQLEQHEILKAWLMEHLPDNEAPAFSKIWDACSDMSCYVQMRFGTGAREALFGRDYDAMPTAEAICSAEWKADEKRDLTIGDIVGSEFSCVDAVDSVGDGPSRFESIIDFRFFLLHALKVFVKIKHIEAPSEEGPIVAALLDDKKLKASFERVVDHGLWEGGHDVDPQRFVREFMVCLLQVRFLFDKCIIKREFSGDDSEGTWSLKELRRDEKSFCYVNTKFKKSKNQWLKTLNKTNKQILMIQSCLRVSYTSPKVMHWITDLLCELMENPRLSSSYEYLELVERNAKDAVSVFLKSGNYKQGVNTPHIVLNYLDYVIWVANQNTYDDFVFEFRTSVEHWYPRNPSVEMFKRWDDADRFGNLCLVQRNVNSKFSNLHPAAKKETFFEMIKKGSLKLRIMSDKTRGSDEWKDGVCQMHEEEMLQLLRKACGIEFGE